MEFLCERHTGVATTPAAVMVSQEKSKTWPSIFARSFQRRHFRGWCFGNQLVFQLSSINMMMMMMVVPMLLKILNILGHITKGSSSGATLSFALRSKGEGGQPRYLIIQEVAVHFRYPNPQPPPLHPVFARCCPNNTVNTVIFATRSKTHRKYHGFGLPRRNTHRCLYTVFFALRVSKNARTPTIRRFSATTRLRKKMQG